MTLSRHSTEHHTIAATNLETVCASELPLPVFNVVSDTIMFTLINIEWGSGVFQGIVTQIVASTEQVKVTH